MPRGFIRCWIVQRAKSDEGKDSFGIYEAPNTIAE